ncbi:MAG: glutathione peroxidase [Marinobacter sp.]|uniref:glutathione peroxidase n=1 Tax=Marinobacter sp. TaxID=50741 RepID=UPI00349FDCE3
MSANRLFLGGLLALFSLATSGIAQAACPDWLDHDFHELRSSTTFNICEAYGDTPILVVNTASFCGFSGQFRGLESLHKTYSGQGLAVVGVPSNDFRQEARTEEKTAEVCFVDYGVTFKMTSPQSVRGESAHPLFRKLAELSGSEPQWNFNKYLIDPTSGQVWYFPSHVRPGDAKMTEQIEALL